MSTQGNNQKDTVSSATLVTKYARTIILQKEIKSIKEIPNLPKHQQAAKTQARKWESDIWPLIIKTTAEVIDFAYTFRTAYEQLLKLVPRLKAGDAEAKSEFKQVLQVVLIQGLEEKTATASDIASQVKQFHDDFQPLYFDFSEDFKKADALMTKDNHEILDKQSDLTKWQHEADAYEWSMVGLGISLPVTITGTAFFAETGVGLIVGAILMAIEVSALATMLGLYVSAMHHVDDLTNEINQLNGQVAQLTKIEKQITGLHKNIEKVLTNTENVRNGWIALKDDLSNTVKDLDKISTEEIVNIIDIKLKSAYENWGTALKTAKALQPNGGRLDAKQFNSSTDMIKAIDDQAKKAARGGA